MASPPDYRRRRLLATLAVAGLTAGALALVAGGGGDDGAGEPATQAGPAPPELPGGGRTIFPDRLVVATYGAPQADELGDLGIGKPREAGQRLLDQAAEYEDAGLPVLPAMELIAEIANRDAGTDGLYRTRQPDAIIRRYLNAAREVGAILILDLQPGHASLFAEAQAFEKWLREPDVSLALDPEWHTPGAVPGTVIGSIEAREVNAISFWLEELVREHDLPQKLLVVHRFTEDMISEEETLKAREHVAVTVNVDGFGQRRIKVSKYHAFAKRAAGLYNGFKLFYREDVDVLPPRRVLKLNPRPNLVVYE